MGQSLQKIFHGHAAMNIRNIQISRVWLVRVIAVSVCVCEGNINLGVSGFSPVFSLNSRNLSISHQNPRHHQKKPGRCNEVQLVGAGFVHYHLGFSCISPMFVGGDPTLRRALVVASPEAKGWRHLRVPGWWTGSVWVSGFGSTRRVILTRKDVLSSTHGN
jgi:hypothetical protein